MPVYFHELTDAQWEKLKDSDFRWNEAAERFKQPPWCSYPYAVDPMGCWSLVGRKVTGEDFCKDCDLYQAHNVQIEGLRAFAQSLSNAVLGLHHEKPGPVP